jgi:hypothetical protein
VRFQVLAQVRHETVVRETVRDLRWVDMIKGLQRILAVFFYLCVSSWGDVYAPASKLSPRVEIQSRGTGYSVTVEMDKVASSRPAVAKSIQRSEAEHFLHVGLSMHLKAQGSKIEVSGKEMVSEGEDGARVVYRFVTGAVTVSDAGGVKSDDEVRVGDSKPLGLPVPTKGAARGAEESEAVVPPSPLTKRSVRPVEVSESLSRRLSKIPTSLSAVNDEWIERFRTSVLGFGKGLEAAGRGSEFEEGVREIVLVFSLFVENDVRVLTFDKMRLRKKFDELADGFSGKDSK